MGTSKKIRADVFLADLGLAPSRARAQSLILAGAVYQKTERIEKPSQLVSLSEPLRVKGKDHPYVSRGGLKLKAALDYFKINVEDKICLDVGASTGGFTDCLLKEGAKTVYALDVGYGQLDWSLQKDSRVGVLDRENFRYFDPKKIERKINFVCIDVSFISLDKIFPPLKALLVEQKKQMGLGPVDVVALIKPQFEVGRQFIKKGGIVKDENKKKECVERLITMAIELGFQARGTLPSPIFGMDGNEEFLAAFRQLNDI